MIRLKINKIKKYLKDKLDLIKIITTSKKTIERLENKIIKLEEKEHKYIDKLNLDKWEIRSYQLQIKAIDKYLKKNPNEELEEILKDIRL